MKQFWTTARHGRLTPWEQAKAVALREASREIHGGKVKLQWVCDRLKKVGGGAPKPSAMCEWFLKVDKDSDWFPGKHSGAKRGPAPQLTKAKRKSIASALMAAKKRGEPPCAEVAARQCPKAMVNDATGALFSDWALRKVMAEDCFDCDPNVPWKYQTKLQKVFIPEPVKLSRVAMCRVLLGQFRDLRRDAQWWYSNVVWFDSCATILPGSPLQYERMRQKASGEKAWLSDDAKTYSPQLFRRSGSKALA